MDFKRLLLNYRAENDLTQEELGQILGFPRTRITEWENGVPPRQVNEVKVRNVLERKEL